jgi:hypothetical protein
MIIKLNQYVFFIAVLTLLLAGGCGEREREPGTEDEIETNGRIDTTEFRDTTMMNDTTRFGKEAMNVPDITGTWSGKLDAHNSTLRITNQDSLTFTGKISTNFREAIHQEVKGKYNPEDRTLTMRDQLQSRYSGTYYAKFSENMNSMSGTFTMKHDNTKLNFNYTKK